MQKSSLQFVAEGTVEFERVTEDDGWTGGSAKFLGQQGKPELTNSNEDDEDGNDGNVNDSIFYDLEVIQYWPTEHAEQLTIERRCFFCLREYSGARICLDGRSQTINQVRNTLERSWEMNTYRASWHGGGQSRVSGWAG